MKYFVLFLFSCAFTFFSGAQGTITGFTVDPVNPSNTDTIYVYADLSFTSGGCAVDNQSFSVNGFTIQANAHHCIGGLTYICNTVDTFKINPLPDGTYNFNLSLTSGAAPGPCTPGIVPDDDSTVTFSVGGSGFEDEAAAPISIYPNPVQSELHLAAVADGTPYQLTAVTGQVVQSGVVNNNVITHLEGLPSGIYFLKIETSGGLLVRQLVKE